MCYSNLKIGFAYDRESRLGQDDVVHSVEAEYEDSPTIEWIRSTLTKWGTVIDLPWDADLVPRLAYLDLDLIFNITEAYGSRNRESLVPAIAESLGVACTGSDAVSLGISLDKYLTKVIAHHEGIPTTRCVLVDSEFTWQKMIPKIEALSFPLIAKPNTGGSSMGIRQTSKVYSIDHLLKVVKWIWEECADSALVEEFVPGTDITAGLLFRDKLLALPAAEVKIEQGTSDDFYSFEMKSAHRKKIICPCELEPATAAAVDVYSRTIFTVLGCRDIARVDYRLTPEGEIFFLEINPLPGLSPYYGIYPAEAMALGIEPEQIVKQLVSNAVRRKGRVSDAEGAAHVR